MLKLVVGITGGIGSGKTHFVKELDRCGAQVLDVDLMAKNLVDTRQGIRMAIETTFGSKFFNDTGMLLRRELGKLVFSSEEKLVALNGIIHPPLIEDLTLTIDQFKKQNSPGILVVDIAILFEAGIETMFDVVVLVTASVDKRVAWLVEKNVWSRKEINDRIQSQLDEKEKIKRADVIIENSGTLKDLDTKAKDFFESLDNTCR